MPAQMTLSIIKPDAVQNHHTGAILDRLEKNGVDAYVIADAKNGREMQRAIKEYENIRDKNKH